MSFVGVLITKSLVALDTGQKTAVATKTIDYSGLQESHTITSNDFSARDIVTNQ